MSTSKTIWDYTFIPYMTIRPMDIQADDVIAVKIMAVAGHGHSWAAYMGNTGQDDEDIIKNGDKINQEAAEVMFPQFKNAGWRYRP